MKGFKLFGLLTAFLFAGVLAAQNLLVPQPQKLTVRKGTIHLRADITIQENKRVPEIAYFQQHLETTTPFHLKTTRRNPMIKFLFIPKEQDHKEGFYLLKIDQNGIQISAPDSQGLFYGLQTLLQLFQEHQKDLTIPYLEIEDFPKYGFRGMMLDVSRHFFTVAEVEKYLDYLAAYKYNKFHWHLTDDQGWRIQIKKYPKLAEVGAWRDSTQIWPYSAQLYDHKRYGGFYTQDQIKQVVAYAKRLYIDVIPEIEMPGHSQAAIASYPDLGCTDKKIPVWTQWGVSQNIYCPTETTFKFLENVLDEVMSLFPYEYIHIGGDETPKTAWKNSVFCQELIKKLGLQNEEQLQSYFIARMEKYLNSKGRQIIGWNEILEGGLAPNATVMSWTGTQGGIAAAKEHHKAIMAPIQVTYFSRYQGNPRTQLQAAGGYTPLKKVYDYNPTPKELSAEEAKYIWGTEGALWTEWISTWSKVQYMIFPRLLALSEVAWGTAKPDRYENFAQRVVGILPILKKEGINYSPAIFETTATITKKDGQQWIQLSSIDGGNGIHYTTDGTEPTITSTAYTTQLELKGKLSLKAAYFHNGKRVGAVLEQEFTVDSTK